MFKHGKDSGVFSCNKKKVFGNKIFFLIGGIWPILPLSLPLVNVIFMDICISISKLLICLTLFSEYSRIRFVLVRPNRLELILDVRFLVK